jgi:DNA-binding HxlR family transcriptional regulator
VASAERAAPPKTTDREGSAVGRRTDARRSACPVACALDVVGDRWTLLLIRDLLGGKRRYGEFLASSEKIPTNILADRLKRLEREGLIRRVPYSAHPPRDEYELTVQGRELGAAVEALAIWGTRHFPGTRRRPRPSADQDLP